MKRNIYIIAILVFLVSACEDFLDKKPLGQSTTESFLGNPETSEESFETMIHACYSVYYISENSWGSHNHHGEWMFGDWLSDDCEKGGNGLADFPEVLDWRSWNIVPVSGHHENNAWMTGYLGVARANVVLQLIERYKDNLSDAVYERIKGEAYFIRGYFYFYLARIYGSVPYFSEPVLPDQYKNAPKLGPEELYANIEQDLRGAVSLIPEKSAWVSVYPGGRATKGAARAILARVLTMEIGFSFNGVTWEDVYEVTNDLVSSQQYNLVPNYATIFEMEGEQSSESVFEIECVDLKPAYGDPGGNLHPIMVTLRPTPENSSKRLPTGGWGFSCPTQSLFDAFEAGDVRRECTIIKDGDILWEDGDPLTDEQIIVSEAPICPTGYWCKKYCYNVDLQPSDNTNSEINMRIVRYAEVLLTHAEACYHTGNEADARIYVNMVRDRARTSTPPKGSVLGNSDYPPAPDPAGLLDPITSSGADLLAAIKHERRVELALEGNRAWDLIRWGEYEDALRTRIIPDDWFLGGENPEQVVQNYNSHLIDGVPTFPIPPDEVEQFGIEQNPGY
jgi:hypothetical protein